MPCGKKVVYDSSSSGEKWLKANILHFCLFCTFVCTMLVFCFCWSAAFCWRPDFVLLYSMVMQISVLVGKTAMLRFASSFLFTDGFLFRLPLVTSMYGHYLLWAWTTITSCILINPVFLNILPTTMLMCQLSDVKCLVHACFCVQ